MDAATVKSLLSGSAPGDTAVLDKLVSALEALGAISAPEVFVNPSLEADVATIVSRLRRIEGITMHFGISVPELRRLLTPYVSSASTPLLYYAFTVDTPTTLVHYQRLQASLSPPHKATLQSLVAPAASTAKVSAAKVIAEATEWSEALLERILAANTPDVPMKTWLPRSTTSKRS
jgi:hypothetical protein